VYVFITYFAARGVLDEWGQNLRYAWPGLDAAGFAFEYVGYVYAESEYHGDIARWYAPGAVRPDTKPGRLSTGLPPESDEKQCDRFLASLRITVELNLEDKLSKPCFSDKDGLYRRISGPGEPPVFVYPRHSSEQREDRQSDGDWRLFELRHNPGLAKGNVLLTFELRGTDVTSGALKHERHLVRFVENAAATRDENQPPLLIMSHTIEELPPVEPE